MNEFATTRDIERRKRRLLAVKLLLGAAALGLIFLVVIFPMNIPVVESGFRLSFSDIKKIQGEDGSDTTVMEHPRFTGLDSNNLPYNVIADTARQSDDNTVLLSKIDADMTLVNGGWLMLTAKGGTFLVKEKTLLLKGDVEVHYDQGYEMRTPSAVIDLAKSMAYGQEGVWANGVLGALKADAFQMESHNQQMIFLGNVKMKVYPAPARAKSDGS